MSMSAVLRRHTIEMNIVKRERDEWKKIAEWLAEHNTEAILQAYGGGFNHYPSGCSRERLRAAREASHATK